MYFVDQTWPLHFACFCGDGQLWWQREQACYRCKACTKVMTQDVGKHLIGVWDGDAPAAPWLTREQAWDRAPTATGHVED